MLSYALRRILQAIFVVWGAVTVLFVILRIAPGDPALLYAGDGATAVQLAQVRQQLGLDGSIWTQYLRFLSNILHLDFGQSLSYGVPALDIALQRLPASVALALLAVGLAVVVGMPLGILAATRRNTLLDRVISGVSQVGQSLPGFWVGLMLILIFSARLGVLPSGGIGGWKNFVMPVVALSLPFMAVMVRLSRGGLLDVMGEAYVTTAKGKGLSNRSIVYRTAVPNMLIPIVTVVGLQLGTLMGGAVVLETVFSWPGVGRLLVEGIQTRDYALVQVVVAIIAVGFVLINLVVDLVYAALDPRIRLGAAS